MKYKIFIISLLSIVMLSSFIDKPAYKIFDEKGKETDYAKMLKTLKEADMIFFGELHNCPIAHWLEYELTKEMFQTFGNKLVLGAEMFEADNQLIFNEYLNGLIPEAKFEEEMRLWNNYSTDYKPIVTYSKENKIPFIATNIPRRYANMVFKNGMESLNNLSDEAKKFIAPLPIPYDGEVGCYKKMMEMSGGMGGHGGDNLPKSQAVKDATMAHFILNNWSAGKVFFHFNGSYHSDFHEGIIYYLLQQKPDLKIVTISTVRQTSIDEVNEENIGVADFVICVPETMTNTY